MNTKRSFVAMTTVRFGAWPVGVWLNKQVDTECTEFPRSFIEKKIMRFAQAAWFVRRSCQVPRRMTLFVSWMPAFAGMTVRNRVHSTWRSLTAARCQERAR